MNIKKKLLTLSTASMALVLSAALCGSALLANAEQYNTPELRAALSEVGWLADKVSLKPATDFAGNPYVIGEAKDGNGHFIYNVDEATLTEFSFKGESPYHGLTSNLIYGGAGSYFVQRGDSYVSVMESEKTYQVSDVAPYAAYHEVVSEEREVSTYASNETINVQHPEYFYEHLRRYACGYFTAGDGRCGFVALGMLVAYADKYKNDNYMDDKFYFNNEKTGLRSSDSSIGKYLYDLHPKESTTSMHIKETMNLYVEERNKELSSDQQIKIDYYSRWTPFYSNGAIAEAIQNDNPVILFGGFDFASEPEGSFAKSMGSHAIVCYGAVKTNKYYWRCHTGWTSSSDCDLYVIDGTIGSVYYFEAI